MPKPYKKSSDAELLEMLATRCTIRANAESPGEKNRQFRILVKISCELLRRGHPVHPKILALLEHENPYVRFWTACLALEIDPPRAEQVLEEIGRSYRGNLHLGFSAEFTLKQWHKGDLRTISSWGCNKITEIRPSRRQAN
jgi:hypothetical protein